MRHFRPRLEAVEGRFLLSTVAVLNRNDSGAGSLRAAIAVAQSGDTIVFDSSLNGQTIALTSGELVVNKSLDIEGPGAGQMAIDGEGASRIFDVTSQNATLTLAGLTIQNGSTAGDGAGIENCGNLTVSGVTFSGNYAGNNGGAIDNRGTLNMVGCTVGGDSPVPGSPQGNSAQNEGGGVENRGTAIITDSVFNNNYGFYGGAIDNRGSLTLQDSYILENVDYYATVFNLGTMTLSGCTFSQNDNGDVVNLGTAVVSVGDVGYVERNYGTLIVSD